MCVFKCRISQSIYLGGLLEYYTPNGPNNGDLRRAYMYASGLLLITLLRTLLYHWLTFGVIHCGMKLRVASCSAIFYKVYSKRFFTSKKYESYYFLSKNRVRFLFFIPRST